jgi:hypothetical protein
MLTQQQQPLYFSPTVEKDADMTLEEAIEAAGRSEYCRRCERAADDEDKHGCPFDSCDMCGAC